jgi:hypothetical protein
MVHHVSALSINPTSWLQRVPVLGSKVIALIMKHMTVQKMIQLVQVEKWHHGIAMVLSVKVGIP